MAMTEFERLLAGIEQYPLQYMRDEEDIGSLETLFAGYAMALQRHGIGDDCLDFNRRFGAWLGERLGWSVSRGWAVALRENASSELPLAATFFLLARQFFAAEL